MKKLFLSIAVAMTSVMAFAQDAEPSKVGQKGEPTDAISALNLAADLVKYGYENQSALALADAVQILAENPTKPLDAEKEGADAAVSFDGKNGKVTFDCAQILADAKSFAKGNNKMLAVIDQVEKDAKGASRGNVNGASYDEVNVPAHGTVTYYASFRANQLAEVAVVGDGDTDLDLYVYDANGNLIGSDIDYTDACYVRWVPAWTGRFTIKIMNRGSVYNHAVVMTN